MLTEVKLPVQMKVRHRSLPRLLKFMCPASSLLYCNSFISYTWSWRLSVTIQGVVDNV